MGSCAGKSAGSGKLEIVKTKAEDSFDIEAQRRKVLIRKIKLAPCLKLNNNLLYQHRMTLDISIKNSTFSNSYLQDTKV